MLVLDFHAAAQHLQQVGNDLTLEYLGIVGFQAVQYLAPHRHDALVLRVPAELHRSHSRVALHDVQLPAARVLGPAVHKLLHPVGDIHTAG